ncbi:amidohydrolase [Verticiella sediminum]|uniref:Amidohydrolase n=1 Tax=Verticiella sediminum TaxID=1247510 RepID=A0A556B1H3_9BURK|nr:amidohydrolase [Verticiella sediminum]TSH98585.1 amidohydrolase [Verticiella sediminum]
MHPLPRSLRRCALALAAGALPLALHAQNLSSASYDGLREAVDRVAPQMVEWRRDIHAHPELSGQEERTAKLVAEHLRSLGMEVQTGVGGHGVVGTLRGARPGPTVALRADMDALPVAERTGLPFASTAKAEYLGNEVPVMHACGHDAHVAMLMGAASALAGLRDELAGTVRFVFQPAEEGAPVQPDAEGRTPAFGARAMIDDGALQGVDAIYGLHITANLPSGTLGYRSGPMMAGSDSLTIHVHGRGGHGSSPWNAVDPILAASQIVVGLQGIVSRQLNISQEPAVLTIGSIHGGTRSNIIPDDVEMQGTLRTFDEGMREQAHQHIVRTAEHIAQASGAQARVRFGPVAYPVTTNDPKLTDASLPALELAADGKVTVVPKVSGSEDFSEFQKQVPGFFFLLGAPPAGKDYTKAPPNHSAEFDVDEQQFPVGARALATLAMDYLARSGQAAQRSAR